MKMGLPARWKKAKEGLMTGSQEKGKRKKIEPGWEPGWEREPETVPSWWQASSEACSSGQSSRTNRPASPTWSLVTQQPAASLGTLSRKGPAPGLEEPLLRSLQPFGSWVCELHWFSKLNIWEACLSGEGLKKLGWLLWVFFAPQGEAKCISFPPECGSPARVGLDFMVRLFQPFLSTLMWAFSSSPWL